MLEYNSTSSNNNLIGNTVSSTEGPGIHLHSSSSNLIYDNFFNNTINYESYIDFIAENYWNTSKLKSTNIVSGKYLGGNFWANPSGTGFSQACPYKNNDGICDIPYIIDTKNIDFLPLSNYKVNKEKKELWINS
jgi:parallel beta-helix repeat protein